MGMFLQASTPQGQTSNQNPWPWSSGQNPWEGVGSRRPGVELGYGKGLGFRNGTGFYLRLFPAFLSMDFFFFLASRRWRPKVALFKQSLLALVSSVCTLQFEVPETNPDQILGDHRVTVLRFKKWKVNPRPGDFCPRCPRFHGRKGLR